MSFWWAVCRSLETPLKNFLDRLSVVSAEMANTLLILAYNIMLLRFYWNKIPSFTIRLHLFSSLLDQRRFKFYITDRVSGVIFR